MKKIITIFLVLFSSLISFSQSTTLVISQIYGAGGNTGAVLNADYVELHNVSGSPISLAGYTIQYASSAATGTWTGVSPLPSVSVPAGGYYLIQMTTAGATGAALPTPDYVSVPTIAMAAANGRVALVNGLTALSACPTAASYVDLVGYGTATCFEGGGPTAAVSTTLAAFRNNNGCTDTDNNDDDFTVLAPAPRNSATAVAACGAVSPSLSATTLTGFGNVCVGTSAGPNSFTITGSNLTNADVTVAALTGFTYSTTSGGTYTASLTLPQAGGTFSQQVFVNFDPVAVQSYNGNIVVNGGGVSAAINVAATGAGVNSLATVTTGAASAITSVSATCAGSYGPIGCSAVTAYGIEYSTTNGFPDGTGTQVPSTNQVTGAFTSDLLGLTAGVTYYYKAYATNSAGTAYGVQQSFTTISLSPVITVTALTSFGNVCVNTTSAANSFTVSGTNLTTADITVGPLAGFSFSTTSGGTYTASLTLTQSGGTYSQEVFVQLSPVAVQSYDGTIPVSGGGAPATSVAATGSGVNTAGAVTAAAATAITSTSATLPGTITSTGCSAVTAYGVEYSTTNNFPNGTGTQVASTNLAAGAFSSGLTGLIPGTTYYYHAYVTNAGGTSYSVQQSFTTAAPVLTATALADFGDVCVNITSTENSFTITSTALTNANVTVGPRAGYSFSTTAAGPYTASLSLTQPGGPYTQIIYVRFSPTAAQTYNGNIPVSGGGAAAISVAVSGTGINTAGTVSTGSATVLSANAATLGGAVAGTGCSPVTSYGIEYSGISGLQNGFGTKVAATNNVADFSVTLNSLVKGTTYYYKAYASSASGTVYGDEKSFTLNDIPSGLIVYGTPIVRGGNVHYTLDNIKPGHYQTKIFNSIGQLVYQRELVLQVNFIDDNFILPVNIGTGVYTLQVYNLGFKMNKTFMVQ